MKTLNLIALALAAAPVLTAVPAFAADDAAFLTDAMKGDNSEVAMGKLAEQRGATAATRHYGQMLVHDHGAHRVKVATLARAMGVHATTALSDDAMQMRSMLMGLHGEKFDAAFKQGMIDDHQKDIAKYQDEASSAQSPKVKHLAEATLPTLNKHLAAAQAL
jgi:putative membrane protein